MVKVDLPPETWLQIIEDVAYVPDNPSAYIDNDVPGDTLYSIPQEYARDIRRTFKNIRNLSLVCWLLHSLSVPYFFETVEVTKEETLWKLVECLQTSSSFKEDLFSHARRLVFIINEDDEEIDHLCHVGEGASKSLLVYRRQISPSRYPTQTVDRICAAVTKIISGCRQLSHLSCHLPWCNKYRHSPREIYKLGEAREYIARSTVDFSSHLPPLILQNLHTLRVGRIGEILRSWIIDIDEFPNLHTLQGPCDVIFLFFRKVRLPSLRNVILGQNDDIGISSEDFFKMHGHKIRSLVSLNNFGEDFLVHCPNLQDLVVDILDIMSFIGENSQVKRLGICTHTPDNPPGTLWEHFFRYIAGTYGPYMTNLEVVRLVNRNTCRDLRQNNAFALRVWDRRLRDRDVRLEDERGALMVNTATPVSVILDQLDINNL